MSIARPDEREFAPFYAGYVSLVPEDDIMSVLERQAADVRRELHAFVPQRETFRYAEASGDHQGLAGA